MMLQKAFVVMPPEGQYEPQVTGKRGDFSDSFYTFYTFIEFELRVSRI